MSKPLTLDELAVVIREWLIEERKRMVEPPQDATVSEYAIRWPVDENKK